MGRQKDQMICMPRAVLGRGFVAPRYSAGAHRFMRSVGGLYLRFFEGVSSVSILEEEVLIDQLIRFYDGRQRLIITFRHVAKEDAPVVMYLLSRKLNRTINRLNRERGPSERIIPHAHFLYGKDVLNWAGKAALWLFPRIGCVPVQNRWSNRRSLDILREAMSGGSFPVALAPESQVTYHMYQCAEISSGVSSLASWGESASEEVTILPLAIGYRHAGDQREFISQMLLRWEQETGMLIEDKEGSSIIDNLREVTDRTLGLLEGFYQIPKEDDEGSRISAICEAALEAAEALAGIEATGSWLDRLFRIRYTGAYALRPEDHDPARLSPIGRQLADFSAMEAHIYLRHSQIVDVLEYLDPSYIKPGCSLGRCCEYILDMLDLINRMSGGNINTRYTPKRKRAAVLVGEPLRLSQLPDAPEAKRKERLSKVTDATRRGLEEVSRRLEGLWEDSYTDF